MKNFSIILALGIFVSSIAFGETCPPVKGLNPLHPPAGWKTLLPPFDDTSDPYYFGSAIHSFNGSFYFKHIICEYETCPSWGCYKFEIISENTFEQPIAKVSPWDKTPVISQTLVCTPPDHEPNVCNFS